LEFPFDRSKRRYEPSERLAELERLESPRTFKLHVPWDFVPRRSATRSKIITVTRDVRDVVYSAYMHGVGVVARTGPAATFEVFFDRWLKTGLYFEIVRSMWAHRDDPALLWLRYEDMKSGLLREAEKIVAFLGWRVDPDVLELAVSLVDFDRLRE